MKKRMTDIWSMPAYRFKLYRFLKEIDSDITVENENEIKSISMFLRIPKGLIYEGLNDLEEDGFIVIDDFQIKIQEVELV